MKLDVPVIMAFGDAAQVQAAIEAEYGISVPIAVLQVFADNSGSALAFQTKADTYVSILRDTAGRISPLYYAGIRDYQAISYVVKDGRFMAATWMADGTVFSTGIDDISRT